MLVCVCVLCWCVCVCVLCWGSLGCVCVVLCWGGVAFPPTTLYLHRHVICDVAMLIGIGTASVMSWPHCACRYKTFYDEMPSMTRSPTRGVLSTQQRLQLKEACTTRRHMPQKSIGSLSPRTVASWYNWFKWGFRCKGPLVSSGYVPAVPANHAGFVDTLRATSRPAFHGRRLSPFSIPHRGPHMLVHAVALDAPPIAFDCAL